MIPTPLRAKRRTSGPARPPRFHRAPGIAKLTGGAIPWQSCPRGPSSTRLHVAGRNPGIGLAPPRPEPILTRPSPGSGLTPFSSPGTARPGSDPAERDAPAHGERPRDGAQATPDPPASAHPDRPKDPSEPPRSPRPGPRRRALAGNPVTVAGEPGHPDATGELHTPARLPPAGSRPRGPDPPRPAPPSDPSRPAQPLRLDPRPSGLVEKSLGRRKVF